MLEYDLESLLRVRYPHIEFIIINDRSTDKTGEIINRFAAIDNRIKAIHITELPQGWLGKVNALRIGEEDATGEWLLFTDADIRFENDVLERAVAYVEVNNIDHLSLLPSDRSQSEKLLLPLFVMAFGAMFVERMKARHIGDKNSAAFTGVGAFNLVRRTAFEKTPGFKWLKMEVIDDVGLGLMLKKTGTHSALLSGEGLLSFEWYTSLREAIHGLEKNAFAGFARYSYLRGVSIVLRMWCLVLLPFIVALAYHDYITLIFLVLLYFMLPGFIGIVMKKTIQIRSIFAALLPLGYLFVSFAIVNSIIKNWKEKGIRWRDTFYSIDELRKGRRVNL
jgi:glycosyltransferase involved in cell wall biosynthesis